MVNSVKRFSTCLERDVSLTAAYIDNQISNALTREMFGWTPMAFEESIRDSAAAVKRASA